MQTVFIILSDSGNRKFLGQYVHYGQNYQGYNMTKPKDRKVMVIFNNVKFA